MLNEWGISTVSGDAYGGETFRRDLSDRGISYVVCSQTASELYEALEPRLNAAEVELLDDGKLQGQLLTLVWRGNKIDHQSGDHDDWAAACAGAIWLASFSKSAMVFTPEFMRRAAQPGRRHVPYLGGRAFFGTGNER